MGQEQDPGTLAARKATGLTRGLPKWKEDIANVLVAGIDGVMGAVGLGGDSKAAQVGELLSAAAPILGATKALTIGKLAAAKRIPNPIKAYHGSPHDFEQFSLSKIGTGEGAQAYGHGLYFAEKEAVAKDYRNRLTDATADITEVLHRGQPLQLGTPEAHAAKLLGDSGAELRELRSWGKRTAQEAATGQDLGMEDIGKKAGMTGAEYYKRLNDFIQTANKREVAVKRGRMYEVGIHADPNDFLDWDAPITKQPEKVRELVRDGLKRSGYLGPNDNGPRQLDSAVAAWKMQHGGMSEGKMESLISGRGDLLGKTPEEMSSKLRDAGVPGIKYLDGTSRASGRGTRNYVVNDDQLIEVVKKYGIAGALSAGLINQAQADALQSQPARPTGNVPLSRLAKPVNP